MIKQFLRRFRRHKPPTKYIPHQPYPKKVKENSYEKCARHLAQLEADLKSPELANMIRILFADAKAKTDAKNRKEN